jgi:iron complex outermembrane receptor protein
LAVFGEPIEGIRVIGGITYIDAELTKTQGGVNQGKDAPGVPPYRATLSGEWDAPFVPGLTLSGRAIYTSSAYLDQANTLKVQPYTIVDLGARLSLDAYGVPIVVRANVLNVFDENYWVSLNGPLSLGSPRTFLLSTSVNF